MLKTSLSLDLKTPLERREFAHAVRLLEILFSACSRSHFFARIVLSAHHSTPHLSSLLQQCVYRKPKSVTCAEIDLSHGIEKQPCVDISALIDPMINGLASLN